VTDGRLPELCGSRFAGVITTAELVAAGVTRTEIRSLVRRGVLTAACYGVYADASSARNVAGSGPDHSRMLAAAAAAALAGPDAVVSHEDAAVVHGLALLERPPSGVSAITRPPAAARGRRARRGIRSRTAALPSRHVVVRHRIPVTSVERTVVDLARMLPFAAAVVTADSALHRRLTTASRLYRLAGDCAGWPGIRRATDVIDFSHPGAESPLESIARVLFRDGGLPAPVLQARIIRHRRVIGRADFLRQEQWTIAEADGAIKYADPGRARLQLRRDTELRQAGYEVVHFTWHDITSRSDEVIAQILAAFERAARLRPGRELARQSLRHRIDR
jgi:hypothetical protein